MSERRRLLPEVETAPVLELAAELLTAGGLVVSPTETRYGIFARGDRREVLEKLYRAKGRDLDKPTALLVGTTGEIDQLGKVNHAAELLIKAFLPGPLTLVLASRREWFPPAVVAGKIGVRCSSLPFASSLAGALEAPLTATSANRAGAADFETVDEIEREFGDIIDLYIDAGPLTGKTSTVVDCTGRKPVVLRDGAISRKRIEAALI